MIKVYSRMRIGVDTLEIKAQLCNLCDVLFMQTSSRLNKVFNKVVVWSQVRIESRPSGNALKVECAN